MAWFFLLLWGQARVEGLTSCVAPQQPVREVAFYVAPNGDDRWSGTLSSPNRRRTDGPFATIHRAVEAIRALKHQHGGVLKQPITVYMRGGTYFLREPIVLTPEDSGSEACPITFTAYRKERPVISGGRRITGWQKQGDLWVAHIPDVQGGKWYFRILRVGREWAIRVRYPNYDPKNPLTGGWLFAQQPSDRTQITLAPDKFPNFEDWRGAEVHVFPAWGWVNAIVKVDGVNQTHHRLFVECAQDIRPGNRLFIANLREALDAPDEWYLDPQTGELCYKPTHPDFPNVEVVAPAMDRLIVLQGDAQASRFVEHLHFRGLTFTDTDYTVPGGYYTPDDSAIWMSATRRCIIDGCTFSRLGGYAVRLEQRSHENAIIRNTMEYLGQGGVLMLGETATQPFQNLIAGNIISDCGLIYKHVGGVYVTSGSGNRIAHNRIMRVPRYGISLKSLNDKFYSHQNIIEFNELIDTNLETNDTGAIETLGRDQGDSGNIIRFNYIRNVVGMGTTPEGEIRTPYFTWGIYLDDYSSGTLIYGNIVMGTVLGAVCLHGGKDNRVENNIFIDGKERQITLHPRDEFMKSNIFRRNIIVFREPDSAVWYTPVRNWPRQSLEESDFNLYWSLESKGLTLSGGNITPLGDWQEWQNAEYDKHSIVADPGFVAFEKGDFRLKPSSPAFNLGFKPIPVERIGPKGFRSR